ncbi:MAG: efflux RND transporter periplasmic adaptor subunit [Proteobacteria bacterium]|nr:efflux RND transporter periplasmic adaptor subunit [Pseudomonadota bacterium]
MQLPSKLSNRNKASIILTAVLLVMTFTGCKNQKNEYVEPPPPKVTVNKPTKQNVTDFLEFSGRISAIEKVDIRARVVGFLQSIHFEEGKFVKKGDLLYEIDPKLYEALLNETIGELAKRQARLERAEIEYKRHYKLYKQNAASEASVVKWKEEIGIAKGDIAADRAAIDKARLELSYTKIQAPMDGRIGRTLVDVGNLVGAGEYTHLTTVAKYDPIYAYFSVNERDLLKLEKMTREKDVTIKNLGEVTLELGLANESGYPQKGRLNFADLELDSDTGTMLLRGVFPNPGPNYVLLPGFFARIRLPYAERKDALLVKERALGLDQGGRYLLVVNNQNEVEQRYVEIGALAKGMRVIEKGLKADEWVVVKGLQRAIPGAKVDPKQAETIAADAGDDGSQKDSAQPQPAAEGSDQSS